MVAKLCAWRTPDADNWRKAGEAGSAAPARFTPRTPSPKVIRDLEHFCFCSRLLCLIHSAFSRGMGGRSTGLRSTQFTKALAAGPGLFDRHGLPVHCSMARYLRSRTRFKSLKNKSQIFSRTTIDSSGSGRDLTKPVAGTGQNGISSSEISADWAYSSWPLAAGGVLWSKLAAALAGRL